MPHVNRQIAARLRDGRVVTDLAFDGSLYPADVRRVSATFWTPMKVALRASELLVTRRETCVLDIGSGVGKFCIVGAASTGALFVGVEHREHFVRVARETAALTGTPTARFVHGNFDVIDVRAFDAIYLFNPFAENRWPPEERLDTSIAMPETKFYDDVRGAEALLAAARNGTRVVTYHGFGGQMPRGYRRVLHERQHTGHLDLWLKTSTSLDVLLNE